MMETQRRSKLALGLSSFALLAALAPAPQGADEVANLKAMAGARAAVARKIADFFADPRLAAMDSKGEGRAIPGVDQVEFWTRRFIEAKLDAANGRDERIAILNQDVGRTKALEARLRVLAEDEPGLTRLDSLKAEFYRLDAEYRLSLEKAGR